MRRVPRNLIDKVLAVAAARGLTDSALARALGVARQDVYNWKKRDLPGEKEAAAAKFIGCTIDDLINLAQVELLRREKEGLYTSKRLRPSMVRSDHISVPAGRVPVVGTAQLGDGGYWLELEHPVGSGDGYLDIPSNDRNAYAVRVMGDSMHPRIRSGEFVICEPNHPYGPGDEVLVKTTDGRSMVKEFLYQRDGQLVLNSVNDGHARLSLPEDHVEKIHYVAAIVKSARWRP